MPDFNTLNTLDYIILGILCWSVGWAAWRGFSREFFGLLGLIAAFIITIYGGDILNDILNTMIPDNAVARMVSKLIVFLICILILNAVAGLGASALRALLSRPVDFSLGFLFGFIRAALIILLPYLLVNLHIDPKIYPNWLTDAQSFQFLEGGANLLRNIMPEHVIRDDDRTDLKPIEKAVEEGEKKLGLDDEADSDEKPQKKSKSGAHETKKDEDSAFISKAKDLFKVLREMLEK